VEDTLLEAFARDFGSEWFEREKAQEALLMREAGELFVPTMRALSHVVSKPSQETWPEQALPYALAFKPPVNWSLEEQTREIALPGEEPGELFTRPRC
jgi:hypothetical protein